MAKRVSFNALDDEDIMNFPLDIEFEDLPEISDSFYEDLERRPSVSVSSSSDETMNASASSSSGSFYDIDDISLSLIPFDADDL